MSNPSKAFMGGDRKESRLGKFLREEFPDEPQDDIAIAPEETAFRILKEYKAALDMLLDWPPRRDVGWKER